MRQVLYLFLLLFTTSIVFGQSGVDSVLTSISTKNKTLATHRQLLEAKRLQFLTGLTPNNPAIEYDYLIGKPSAMGNQTDIIVIQSFDFPTAYIKKSKVSSEQIAALEFEASIQQQEVLLDAKLVCIELIHLNKRIAQLKSRLENARRVNDDLTIKLENEEVSAIDANKAKLMLLNVRTKSQLLQSKREQVLLRLTQMNGGEAITFRDTLYAELPDVPQVNALKTTVSSVAPMLKLYEQQISIRKTQVGLTKAMALPKIETGYHYQSILGQTFNGVHLGISIPLWESRNKVKQSKAYALLTEIELEQQRISYQFEIRELHKKYEALKASLSEYEAVLGTLSSEELLQKSLELGQISFIEYALEMEYYYSAFDYYLQLEKQLHSTIAKLYKHQL